MIAPKDENSHHTIKIENHDDKDDYDVKVKSFENGENEQNKPKEEVRRRRSDFKDKNRKHNASDDHS